MAALTNTTLVIPLSSGPKTNYKRDTTKPDSEKSVLELFFDAQYDIQTGVQPPIIIRNGYLIQHLGQRVRAPTTWETIQEGINKNSDVHKRAQQIENGDFSDDEEDDDELSSMNVSSPRSDKGTTPPPPPSSDYDEPQSQSYNSATATSNSVHSPRSFGKPQPKGRPRGKRKGRSKVSLDEPADVVLRTNMRNNSGSNDSNYDRIDENSATSPTLSSTMNPNNHSNNNNNNNNMSNNNDLNNSDIPIETNTNNNNNNTPLATRKRSNHTKNKAPPPSIAELWFKAQLELSEGRQPHICKKAKVQLNNVRIHVKKYAAHAKRNSRVSPQDFLNVYISKPRKSIAADEDDDDDLTDNELSTSKSGGADSNSPNQTPTS